MRSRDKKENYLRQILSSGWKKDEEGIISEKANF